MRRPDNPLLRVKWRQGSVAGLRLWCPFFMQAGKQGPLTQNFCSPVYFFSPMLSNPALIATNAECNVMRDS
jgi:hypothetical protein